MKEPSVAYLVKFRYYPGDPLVPIDHETLNEISKNYGIDLCLQEITGAFNDSWEETLDKDLETITQTVITVRGKSREAVRLAMKDLIRRYRAPRTVFSLTGSNPAGATLAWDIIEEEDGWW